MTEPQPAPSLNGILGQPRAIATLRASMDSERVHHAWIFAGPFGVGKCTAARALASLLLDPTTGRNLAGELDADPGSETQRLISTNTHPDLHVITKELAAVADNSDLRGKKQRNIPIDLLRERIIGGKASNDRVYESIAWKAPQLGHNKVFIIDEAELLQGPAQNAILKTLEEPPPGTYIFLVTASEERLLPTILSRCQRVSFGPLDNDSMDSWFTQGSHDITADDRAWVDRFAAGSPGRALQAIETGILEWRRTLQPLLDDLDRGRYPLQFAPTIAALLGEWSEAWVTRGEKAGSRPSKQAANHLAARQMFTLLADWAQVRIRDAAKGGTADLDEALRAVELIAQAERQISSNVQPAFAFDNLAAQLTSV